MVIEFGFDPQEFLVRLTRGAVFVQWLDADPAWPDGTEVEIRFPQAVGPSIVWPGVVAGATASWERPPGDVDAVLAAKGRRAQLWYRPADAAGPTKWAEGSVELR